MPAGETSEMSDNRSPAASRPIPDEWHPSCLVGPHGHSEPPQPSTSLARRTTLRFALGGQHKLAGLTGAAYKFTTAKFFTRATGTEPVVGRVIITVEKDRPGYVRGRTDEGGSGSSCSRATRTAR